MLKDAIKPVVDSVLKNVDLEQHVSGYERGSGIQLFLPSRRPVWDPIGLVRIESKTGKMMVHTD